MQLERIETVHFSLLVLKCIVFVKYPFLLFKEKLKGYRYDRLKRRAPVDSAGQEDLELKRSMLQLMERAETQNTENLNKITSNIAQLTSSIAGGFQLLTQMMQQPTQPPYYTQPQSSSYTQMHNPPYCHNPS